MTEPLEILTEGFRNFDINGSIEYLKCLGIGALFASAVYIPTTFFCLEAYKLFRHFIPKKEINYDNFD